MAVAGLHSISVHDSSFRTEPIRRGNRKLCGRQVLLDMLNKAERQRQMELQGLMMLRAVSQFAHRNRIQSILRGRFLRNDRTVEDKRPSDIASSELGLLRRRHTVSGLRDGFISRSGSSVSGQVSNITGNSNVQTEANNSHKVLDELHEQSEPSNQESDSCGSIDGRSIPEGNNVGDISWQESHSHAEERQEQDLEHGARDWLPSGSIEFVERSDITRQNSRENWQEEVLYEESEPTDWLPREASRVRDEQYEPIIDHPTVSGYAENVEANTIEGMNWQEFAAQGEQVVENELTDWHGANVDYNEWRNGDGGDMDVNQQEASEDDREDIYMQEAPEVWQEEDSFHEDVQNWLEGTSNQADAPVGRVNSFYLPDDDNANSTELRELLNRRRVSSLLHSGFRESLDHLVQSYVERQSRASINWELHGTLPSPSGEGDLEQQSRDHNGEEIVAAGSSSLALPSSQMLWDNDSHSDNWQRHDMHQPSGTEWEIINDMRTDMARLQQRMDNMQRMLEACMDMQLELQRSIRQEVSAALNRPSSSPGVSVEGFGSKWDHVRKGICCQCRESNIDSLLYRCGHMCTCSKFSCNV